MSSSKDYFNVQPKPPQSKYLWSLMVMVWCKSRAQIPGRSRALVVNCDHGQTKNTLLYLKSFIRTALHFPHLQPLLFPEINPQVVGIPSKFHEESKPESGNALKVNYKHQEFFLARGDSKKGIKVVS